MPHPFMLKIWNKAICIDNRAFCIEKTFYKGSGRLSAAQASKLFLFLRKNKNSF